jgi:hypothetical protein
MPIRLRGGGGGGSAPAADPKETLNILNGVLNCAWDKTSAAPKLLEIYENSQVKFNIDSDNPLVLAFANGWDDLDRPAQVVKRLAIAPSNIDLSAKVSCHVQICAKVVNDELTITTNDIFDPGWETWTNVIPAFTDANPKNGWTASGDYATNPPWYAFDHNTGTYWQSTSMSNGQTRYVNITSPIPVCIAGCSIGAYQDSGTKKSLEARDIDTGTWETITAEWSVSNTANQMSSLLASTSHKTYTEFRVKNTRTSTGSYTYVPELYLYEGPTAKFFRSLNKVKDRSDVEQLWINIGYATVDASGNITAMNHYTDLRNNYPGGMRVEA